MLIMHKMKRLLKKVTRWYINSIDMYYINLAKANHI